MDDLVVKKKRGRKKGSGVKAKVMSLFAEGFETYDDILKYVVVKKKTFDQYKFQWKKQSTK